MDWGSIAIALPYKLGGILAKSRGDTSLRYHARVIGGKLSANARDDARECKCYFVNSALEPDSRLLSITRACVEAWQCTHARMSMCLLLVVLVGG